jgi:hypothetical protein
MERLEERRTRKNHQLMYNIQNGATHPYLLDLIPSTIQKYDYLSSSKWQRYYCSIGIGIEVELRIAFLNLDNVSRLLPERLRLFHSLTVARTK